MQKSSMLFGMGFYFLLATFAFGLQAETRVWEHADGKSKLNASFVRLDGEFVILRKASDDKQIKVALKSLSSADQDLAKRLAREDNKNFAETLMKTVKIEANGHTLSDVLANGLPVPVYIKKGALRDAGISAETPLNISLEGKLGATLDKLLEPLKLCWSNHDSTIVVTTIEESSKFPEIVIYKIRSMKALPSNARMNLQPLQQKIETEVPVDWREGGGSGVIIPIRNTFAILQSPYAHRRIAKEMKSDLEPVTHITKGSQVLPESFRTTRVSLPSRKQTLEDALSEIAKAVKCKLEIDRIAMEKAGIDLQAVHGLELTSVSARTALILLADHYALDWGLEEKQLRIATPTSAKNAMYTLVWKQSAKEGIPVAELARSIALVVPGNWTHHGGGGTITPDDKSRTIRLKSDFQTLVLAEQFIFDLTASAKKK